MVMYPVRRTDRIERTPSYAHSVQAISRYAAYPYRDDEPQLPPEPSEDWNLPFRQAAQGASEWAAQSRQARSAISGIRQRIGPGLNHPKQLEQELHQFAQAMNELRLAYDRHAGYLKPALITKLEHVLASHPAAKLIGLSWNEAESRWYYQEDKLTEGAAALAADAEAQTSLLTGRSGLLREAEQQLTGMQQVKVIDLVRPGLKGPLPYTSYYASMQSYWPLPAKGLLLNQLV
ncbi:hypothetical protein ACFO9Q_04790 [Paenibacillus sp. GCM10023252]|uniref:hypothetical protein n=1 Tax=Paenibacillus sp. GCM10023252 TaxID=3252649 RepID=UPI003620B4F5